MPSLRLLVAALLLLWPQAPLSASSFTVVPTRIVLEGERRSGSLSVRNDGSEPVLVQVEPQKWLAAVPAIRTEPTRELVAVPAVFRLAPGSAQTVRIGLRGAPQAGVEVAYRLLLTEVPTSENAQQGGVRFALRLSIPVFVRAPGADSQLIARLQQATQGWVLAVHNAGNAHARLSDVRARRKRGSLPISGTPGYLLPGETRIFPLRASDLAVGETLFVELESQGGSQSFELVVGDG
jgi:fimbrial chaperone protein